MGKMNRRAIPSAKLRQAFFAWTVVLSLVLVWISAQPRPSDFPTHSALVSLSAVQAADHVATLSAAGKMHRSPEFRQGGDPDFEVFAAGSFYGATGLGRDVVFCVADELCGAHHRILPEPRAPPRI